MSIYDQLEPPAEGDLPAFWKGNNPGDSVEGTVVDVRIVKHNEYGDAPCIDIQTNSVDAAGKPIIVPVLASTNSLYRQVYNLRPQVGGLVRITFQGFSGRAKIYQLDYQAPAQGVAAPAAQPQPQPAPAPAFPPATQAAPQPAAAPTGFDPLGQAPAPAAPPWGA